VLLRVCMMALVWCMVAPVQGRIAPVQCVVALVQLVRPWGYIVAPCVVIQAMALGRMVSSSGFGISYRFGGIPLNPGLVLESRHDCKAIQSRCGVETLVPLGD